MSESSEPAMIVQVSWIMPHQANLQPMSYGAILSGMSFLYQESLILLSRGKGFWDFFCKVLPLSSEPDSIIKRARLPHVNEPDTFIKRACFLLQASLLIEFSSPFDWKLLGFFLLPFFVKSL